MKEIVERGAVSQIKRVFLGDAASANGDGKTGITPATAGLEIWVLPEGASVPTVYKQADGTIETVAAIGTYQAPSLAARIRLGQVDAVKSPGLYELHLRNELFAAGRNLVGAIRGIGTAIVCPFEFQLADPTLGVGSPSRLTDIWNQAQRIGTAGALVTQAVDDGGDVTIYVGADNTASLANEIGYTITTPVDLVALGAARITFGVGPKTGAALFIQAATSVTLLSPNTYKVVFEPRVTQNAGLLPYSDYGFTIQLTDGAGLEAVKVEGIVHARRKWN